MVDATIVRDWISRAYEDFQFTWTNFKEGKTYFAQICFLLQQSAEKYLKGYIVAHGLEFRKIRDLPLLLKICAQNDPSFERLREDCEILNPYYIETRYPVHWPINFSREETGKAIEAARRVREVVEQKLISFAHD